VFIAGTVSFTYTSINSAIQTMGYFLACLNKFWLSLLLFCGPGSSVGIATDYGLDGLASNLCGDKISLSSRTALGSTQPPLTWVSVLSRG
jgi:hypothetical protein